jgi:pyruvate/2-oxoglutarate/acetoin dehydrogenase E1 component
MNQLITSYTGKIPGACLYGQNLNNGTFISGLSKNLTTAPGARIINTGNCENSLCGIGFGMMLNGVTSVYFVKQLDFMLLGMDHFVNTYGLIRCSRDLKTLGSYSIIMLVCDQGMQGPQSSVNSYGDYASLARVPCYSLTNSADADQVLRTQLTAPGFRMIALNMRHFRSDFLQMQAVYSAEDSSIFQYSEGDGATIVCFNFSVPEGLAIQKEFATSGVGSSLFSVNYVPTPDWDRIKQSVARTKRLVVLDDSKSVHLPCYQMLDEMHQDGLSFQRVVLTRGQNIDFGVSEEKFPVDAANVVAQFN